MHTYIGTMGYASLVWREVCVCMCCYQETKHSAPSSYRLILWNNVLPMPLCLPLVTLFSLAHYLPGHISYTHIVKIQRHQFSQEYILHLPLALHTREFRCGGGKSQWSTPKSRECIIKDYCMTANIYIYNIYVYVYMHEQYTMKDLTPMLSLFHCTSMPHWMGKKKKYFNGNGKSKKDLLINLCSLFYFYLFIYFSIL